MPETNILVATEIQMGQIAATVAHGCKAPLVIYLSGQLGAGKTTFARNFIQSLGFQGKVKSPTYTLVECYDFQQFQICHFDLYRINHPQELNMIGIDDYFNARSICLIEWPEQGEGVVADADLSIIFYVEEDHHRMEFSAHSAEGDRILTAINKE